MSKITKIVEQKSNSERVNVFIDNTFCVGIRKRTFQAMNYKVEDEISCEQLKEEENFFWKKAYQKEGSWVKEKVRIERIKEIIESIDDRVAVEVVGFGADSNEIIKEHPDEKGVPDLNVVLKSSPETIVMKVEVTGTESLRGEGYWVRPDKIEYALNHPTEIVWTALHYSSPNELIRFLKHNMGKEIKVETMNIRGAGEQFCVFYDLDEEVHTLEEFAIELKNGIER
jgi:hypothetical protein